MVFVILSTYCQPTPCILKILALLLFLPLLAFAQNRTSLGGKISSTIDDLEGIYVINKTADLTVATAKGGYFTVPAAVGDVILFSSIQFVAREITLTPENFNDALWIVKLEFMVRDLDEVTITRYKNLNSEDLGLVPRGQKQYTYAERKLATAGDMRMNPMGLDPLINWMSGRTTMLKKELQIEKKEQLMEKINYIYEEEQIINEFKIPKEYVRGFVYYIVEDAAFAAALKAKNDTMARFLVNGLAVDYLKIIADAK